MGVVEKIEAALETAKDRSLIYGEGHFDTGRAMANLFPNGVTLRTDEDFARFMTFCLIMVKISRYAHNFSMGGHRDSIHDNGVYSFILEDIDDHYSKQKKPKKRRK